MKTVHKFPIRTSADLLTAAIVNKFPAFELDLGTKNLWARGQSHTKILKVYSLGLRRRKWLTFERKYREAITDGLMALARIADSSNPVRIAAFEWCLPIGSPVRCVSLARIRARRSDTIFVNFDS